MLKRSIRDWDDVRIIANYRQREVIDFEQTHRRNMLAALRASL